MAQWIRLRPPFCVTGFEFQRTSLMLLVLLLHSLLDCERSKNKTKKRLELAHLGKYFRWHKKWNEMSKSVKTKTIADAKTSLDISLLFLFLSFEH